MSTPTPTPSPTPMLKPKQRRRPKARGRRRRPAAPARAEIPTTTWERDTIDECLVQIDTTWVPPDPWKGRLHPRFKDERVADWMRPLSEYLDTSLSDEVEHRGSRDAFRLIKEAIYLLAPDYLWLREVVQARACPPVGISKELARTMPPMQATSIAQAEFDVCNALAPVDGLFDDDADDAGVSDGVGGNVPRITTTPWVPLMESEAWRRLDRLVPGTAESYGQKPAFVQTAPGGEVCYSTSSGSGITVPLPPPSEVGLWKSMAPNMEPRKTKTQLKESHQATVDFLNTWGPSGGMITEEQILSGKIKMTKRVEYEVKDGIMTSPFADTGPYVDIHLKPGQCVTMNDIRKATMQLAANANRLK